MIDPYLCYLQLRKCVYVLPQLLNVGGNPRETVHSINHSMLLNELSAALEYLGD